MAEGAQETAGALAEFVVDLDGVEHGAGGDEEAVRAVGEPAGDLVGVCADLLAPVLRGRDGTVPGGVVTGFGVDARQHRPATPGETDRLRPQFDAEGAAPAVRPIRVQH